MPPVTRFRAKIVRFRHQNQNNQKTKVDTTALFHALQYGTHFNIKGFLQAVEAEFGSAKVKAILLDTKKYKATLLHYAMEYTQVDAIKFLIDKQPEALFAKAISNEYPLDKLMKTKRGDVELVLAHIRTLDKSILAKFKTIPSCAMNAVQFHQPIGVIRLALLLNVPDKPVWDRFIRDLRQSPSHISEAVRNAEINMADAEYQSLHLERVHALTEALKARDLPMDIIRKVVADHISGGR